MLDKEIIEILTNKGWLLESYKSEALALKKLVNAINKQRQRLEKFLDVKEMRILAEATDILTPFINYYKIAGKNREQALNESVAAIEKRNLEQFETVSNKYFADMTLNDVISECQDLAKYVWEVSCVSYRGSGRLPQK